MPLIRNRAHKEHQTGVGMIEILITIIVLSVAALGFAGLQLKSLQNGTEAVTRSQATHLARDAIERIQANPSSTALATFRDQNAWGESPLPDIDTILDDCIGTGNLCNDAAMAQWDIRLLQIEAFNTLPSGAIRLYQCPFNTNNDCIVVSWNDSVPADCLDVSGVIDSLTAGAAGCLVLEVTR